MGVGVAVSEGVAVLELLVEAVLIGTLAAVPEAVGD